MYITSRQKKNKVLDLNERHVKDKENGKTMVTK